MFSLSDYHKPIINHSRAPTSQLMYSLIDLSWNVKS